MKVKARGGVRTLEAYVEMLRVGAESIGTRMSGLPPFGFGFLLQRMNLVFDHQG